GPFDRYCHGIRSIHNEASEKLVDVSKTARQQLRDSEKNLESLSFDFIDRPWKELNKITSAGIPEFEVRFRELVRLVGEIRSAIARVFDVEQERDFRYSTDALREY